MNHASAAATCTTTPPPPSGRKLLVASVDTSAEQRERRELVEDMDADALGRHCTAVRPLWRCSPTTGATRIIQSHGGCRPRRGGGGRGKSGARMEEGGRTRRVARASRRPTWATGAGKRRRGAVARFRARGRAPGARAAIAPRSGRARAHPANAAKCSAENESRARRGGSQTSHGNRPCASAGGAAPRDAGGGGTAAGRATLAHSAMTARVRV